MPKRKKYAKLHKYNNKRKKLAQKRRENFNTLNEVDDIEHSLSDQEKNEEIDEEQDSDEYSDEEENEIDEEEMTRIRLLTIPLTWKKRPEIRKIRGIPKSTYYRKFGASGTLINAAKGTSKITDFFEPSTLAAPTYLALQLASPAYSTSTKLNRDKDESEVSNEDKSEDSDEDKSEDSDDCGGDDSGEEGRFELGDIIAQLQENLLKNEKTFSAFEYNERRAVYEYFVRLYDGYGKLKASEAAVRVVYVNPNPYKYKRVRFLGNFFLRHESFPLSHRGRHQKCKRLVDDEDVALKCMQ